MSGKNFSRKCCKGDTHRMHILRICIDLISSFYSFHKPPELLFKKIISKKYNNNEFQILENHHNNVETNQQVVYKCVNYVNDRGYNLKYAKKLKLCMKCA